MEAEPRCGWKKRLFLIWTEQNAAWSSPVSLGIMPLLDWFCPPWFSINTCTFNGSAGNLYSIRQGGRQECEGLDDGWACSIGGCVDDLSLTWSVVCLPCFPDLSYAVSSMHTIDRYLKTLALDGVFRPTAFICWSVNLFLSRCLVRKLTESVRCPRLHNRLLLPMILRCKEWLDSSRPKTRSQKEVPK